MYFFLKKRENQDAYQVGEELVFGVLMSTE